MNERQLGEIFFDGNVKLEVKRGENAISCKGCYYQQYEMRDSHTVPQFCNERGCINATKHDCNNCPICKHEKKIIYVCRRNLVTAGVCQAAFRDDGESVIFSEVCP